MYETLRIVLSDGVKQNLQLTSDARCAA